METKIVNADTTKKTSVKPRRNSSSTIMPLKAWLKPLHDNQSHIELTPAAASPISEIAPVIQRCFGRAKASTSITTTPTKQTISSGAINEKLTSGGVNCIAGKKFIL